VDNSIVGQDIRLVRSDCGKPFRGKRRQNFSAVPQEYIESRLNLLRALLMLFEPVGAPHLRESARNSLFASIDSVEKVETATLDFPEAVELFPRPESDFPRENISSP
jgi:hypothetical protein